MGILQVSVFVEQIQVARTILFERLEKIEGLLDETETALRLDFGKETDSFKIRMAHYAKVRVSSVSIEKSFLKKQVHFNTAMEFVGQTRSYFLKARTLCVELVEKFSQYKESLQTQGCSPYQNEVLLPRLLASITHHTKVMNILLAEVVITLELDIKATQQNVLKTFSKSQEVSEKIRSTLANMEALLKVITTFDSILPDSSIQGGASLRKFDRGYAGFVRSGRIVIREPRRSDSKIYRSLGE